MHLQTKYCSFSLSFIIVAICDQIGANTSRLQNVYWVRWDIFLKLKLDFHRQTVKHKPVKSLSNWVQQNLTPISTLRILHRSNRNVCIANYPPLLTFSKAGESFAMVLIQGFYNAHNCWFFTLVAYFSAVTDLATRNICLFLFRAL